jgi:hypothetical protein
MVVGKPDILLDAIQIDVPIASDAWITRGLKGLHVVLRNVANENK